MKATTFKELVKVVRNYDNFTQYIESYTQEMQARKRNAQLDRQFNELMQEDWAGYNRGVPYGMENDIPKKMFKWLWRADICVEDLDTVDPDLYAVQQELVAESEDTKVEVNGKQYSANALAGAILARYPKIREMIEYTARVQKYTEDTEGYDRYQCNLWAENNMECAIREDMQARKAGHESQRKKAAVKFMVAYDMITC